MKISKSELLALIVIISVGIFLSFFVYDFKLWSQVQYLRDQRADLSQLFYTLHPHALRFLSVQPIYTISEIFRLDSNKIYSLITGGFLVIIPVIMWTTLRHVRIFQSKKYASIVVLIFIASLYFLMGLKMNGRVAWAHLSTAVVIMVAVLWHEGVIKDYHAMTLLSGALIMGSVSSGTFISIWLMIFLMGVCYFYEKPNIKNDRRRLLYIAGLLVAFLPWIIILANKNINYYGGDVSAAKSALNHGAGYLLLSDSNDSPVSYNDYYKYASYAACALLGVIALTAYKWIGMGLFARLNGAFALTSLTVGLYGYSALTLALLPITCGAAVLYCYFGFSLQREMAS
jgi:hypothetical protein